MTTLATYADNSIPGHDVHDEVPGYNLIDVAQDGTMTLNWTEPLAFHAEHNGTDWDDFTDDTGYLTPQAADALVKVIAADLTERDAPTGKTFADNLAHEPGAVWDDEPSVALSTTITPPKGLDTPLEEALALVSTFYVAMLNGTNPGTFDHPYYLAAYRLSGTP